MTDFIKRKANRWFGFWITVAIYMAIQAGSDLGMWLHEVGEEKFTAGLSLWSYLVISVKLVTGCAVILRSLMNGSYQEAKKADPTANTGP